MDDNQIDRAIDDVARVMTEGELDAGFRARIVARLGSRRGIWDSGFGIRAIVAASAVALIVAAVFVARRPRLVEPGVVLKTAAGPEGPDLQRGGPAHAPDVSPDAKGLVAAGPKGPALRGGTAARRLADTNGASTVAALAPPPIDVERLDTPPLDAVDSIQLPPLAVPSIGVTPLPTVDPISQGEMIP